MIVLANGTYNIASRIARQDTIERVDLAASGLSRLVIHVPSGSLTARRGDDTTAIRGTRVITRGLGSPDIDQRRDGDALVITMSCPPAATMWCGLSYDVEVPRALSVELHTNAGRVGAHGLDGDVDLRTTAGDVEASDLGGNLTVAMVAGTLAATTLRSANVTASTTAGEVRLAFAQPPSGVSVRSAAGTIDVEVPAGETRYRVDAGSASSHSAIEVPTDPAADRFIVASTAAGSVRVHQARG